MSNFDFSSLQKSEKFSWSVWADFWYTGRGGPSEYPKKIWGQSVESSLSNEPRRLQTSEPRHSKTACPIDLKIFLDTHLVHLCQKSAQTEQLNGTTFLGRAYRVKANIAEANIANIASSDSLVV